MCSVLRGRFLATQDTSYHWDQSIEPRVEPHIIQEPQRSQAKIRHTATRQVLSHTEHRSNKATAVSKVPNTLFEAQYNNVSYAFRI